MTIENFLKLTEPQVRKVFETSKDQYDQVMPRMFVESEATLNVSQDTGISYLGPALSVAEGAPIPTKDPVQGFTKTYTQTQKGIGMVATEKMIRFELFPQVFNQAAGVKLGLLRRSEQDAAIYLGNGFITVNGADGKPLFDTAHPLTGSAATFSNRITDGAVLNPILSVTALNSAQKQMASTLDDKGQLVPRMPTKLVVGPSLWEKADVIFATARVPGSNDNDVNRWYNTLKLIVNPYLLSSASLGESGTMPIYADTFWALIDDMMNPLVWLWGKRPTLNDGHIDYNTRSIQWNGNYFEDHGHSDFRGVHASKGTTVA